MIFFRKLLAIFKRDCLEHLSYRQSLFLDIASIAASLITFYFIGKLVGSSALRSLVSFNGADYFPFVLLGLALSSFQTLALSGPSEALLKEQSYGTLEAVMMTSTGFETLLSAGFLWPLIFSTLRVTAYFIAGFFLGASFPLSQLPLFCLIVFLSILSLLGLGLFSAGYSLAYKRGNPVQFFFEPLSKLTAGVYFPVALFPLWLQPFTYLNPFTHALEATRLVLLSNATLPQIMPHLTALALFASFLIPLGIFSFHFYLNKAKKDGSLAFC